MEGMVQRLDQLTQDEARLVVAQILTIVYDALGMFLSRQSSDLTGHQELCIKSRVI